MRMMIRTAVAAFALLALTAPISTSAQYPQCRTCTQLQDPDGYYIQGCALPEDNSWGYENCRVMLWGNIQVCRNQGPMCYYMDVQG